MVFKANRTGAWPVAAAALMVSGCNTLFDAPAGSDALDGFSDQTLLDLQTIAQGQALEAMGTIPGAEELSGIVQGGVDAAVQTGARVAAGLNSAKVKRLGPAQAREPALYFEKIASPMPQLVVLSAGQAVVRWNDQVVRMPDGNASHVVLVAPGRHALAIEYADAAVFKAEIAVARYERVTLRVDTAPGAPLQDKQ